MPERNTSKSTTKEDQAAEDDSNKSVVNLGRTGVYLSAIEGDVRTLMRTFQRLQSYDFQTFCQVWKHLNFSLIHFVATEKNSRHNFMRAIYRLILSHFQRSAILEIRIGVLYALYLVYYTQPVNFPNIRIRATQEMWQMFCQAYQYCNEAEIRDVVYVFDKLREGGAFELVAWVDAQEGVLRLDTEEDQAVSGQVASQLAEIEHEVMGSGQGGLADLAASKRQLALSEDYRASKRRLVNTRLIDQATREFYAAEFGTQVTPRGELPGAVPLDISEQETTWTASILTRVREYQRQRAERVGAVAQDDGSLQMLDNAGRVPVAEVVDYRRMAGNNMSIPIQAMRRAEEQQRLRSQNT